MQAFYVRVSLDLEFVREHLLDKTFPTTELFSNLPEETPSKLLFTRYTFAVYQTRAENAEKCAEAFRAAFAKAFPDEPRAVRLLITPDDGSEKAKLMYTVYSGYYGVDEYLSLVTSITGALPFLEARGALRALRMQSYLFAIDRGCGFTTLLSSFADYLNRMGVFGEEENDDGEKKQRTNYSEYKVGRESVGNLTSADDIIEKLYEKKSEPADAGVGIDISYFLDGEKFEELRDFAHRLYPLQDTYVFLFRVPFLEKKAMDRVKDALSDIMLIKTVSVPPLHDCVLLESFFDNCGKHGYKISEDLYDPFFEKISLEKKDGRFYGFKTCEKVSEEIVLAKAESDSLRSRRGEESDAERISISDLSGFTGGKKEEKSGYDQLGELVGMDKIASRIREIVAQVKITLHNEKLDRPCIHMRFVGAPGTGKTTVARIIGQIFREEGILRKGAFLEYSARSLCAEYVGQTAVKTAAICRDAYGSVLFLDEAYALYEGDRHSNDYGREALTTLISEMENHRDDMLVIMAGYTDDMETLMQGNAGLRSRMPYMINFENYSRKQLFEIFMQMVGKHFEYSEDFEKAAREFFDTLSDAYMESKEFANARFVRNLYERTWSKGALRASLDGKTAVVLTRSDFISASGEKEFSERLEQKKAKIGF